MKLLFFTQNHHHIILQLAKYKSKKIDYEKESSLGGGGDEGKSLEKNRDTGFVIKKIGTLDFN